MSVVVPNRSPIYCLCPFGKLIGLCFYPFSFQLWCMQLCSETWQLLYNGCIHDGRYTRASGVIWKISSPCTRWANFPSDHFHNRDAPPPPIRTWLVGAFSSGMAAENIMNSVCFFSLCYFPSSPGKMHPGRTLHIRRCRKSWSSECRTTFRRCGRWTMGSMCMRWVEDGHVKQIWPIITKVIFSWSCRSWRNFPRSWEATSRCIFTGRFCSCPSLSRRHRYACAFQWHFAWLKYEQLCRENGCGRH